MGGVSTDTDGATPLPGLFAAGEVACVSINGANRLGSNSLPELLVFGARAGRAAADYAKRAGDPTPAVHAQAADEMRRLASDLNHPAGNERIASIRAEMHKTMEDSAGIYRTGDWLRKAGATLRELRERLPAAGLDDHSTTFNTELVTKLELAGMLEVAECIVASALRRDESRGAHQRTDFPARDDERFLTHSLARRGLDGECGIDYLPVTITRWPPGERVYGR
jgi:fumarate reductase flavoprotein subunit